MCTKSLTALLVSLKRVIISMSVKRDELTAYLQDLLKVDTFSDYCPNGLQVEGKEQISKIVTGVTASQALIDEAIERDADAILVHHGYFWKNEPATITGMKKQRIEKLLKHHINLFAYHLPLDFHPEFGNNVQLAHKLGIEITGDLSDVIPGAFGKIGRFAQPVTGRYLAQAIEEKLDYKPVHVAVDREIQTLAWCTGGAQGYIDQAAQAGVDAYITGEISEQTVHSAVEQGLHFFAAGHHATERYGVQALAAHLQQTFDVEHEFVDLPIPV